MKYPTLPVQKSTRDMMEVFKGYNHNPRIADGEFYDMNNMTSDLYPVLSPRPRRGLYADTGKASAIIAKEKLCWVDGPDFVIGDQRIFMELTEGEKRLTSMGAYVIILPDRKYINTMYPEDRGNIDAVFEASESVEFRVCTKEGKPYSHIVKSTTEPENPPDEKDDELPVNERMVWINISNADSITLNAYSRATNSWIPITPYTRISSAGIDAEFKKMDGITISGLKDETIFGSIEYMNGNNTVLELGEDFLVVEGFAWREVIHEPGEGPFRVERKMPEVDFLTEAGNRLWGCRYGVANNGEFVNEIYACALGDFKNWNKFSGISTDSYAASCGTDGAFTGAVTLDGHPIFWKETCLHKVYGSAPSNFQIQDTACRGVQTGCSDSLAVVGEKLYYKSRSGVCVYDGSLPVEISTALGQERYENAVAGGIGNKYYICMENETQEWTLFVFDAAKGLWHKEDSFRADSFCSHMGELYAIEHGRGRIVTILGSGDRLETALPWMVQTGPIGLSLSDNKYITKLNVRMAASFGARIRFLVQYDSIGGWKELYAMSGVNMKSFTVPIRPRRCDHFRLRIEGMGDARIYSIAKTMEKGSDYR